MTSEESNKSNGDESNVDFARAYQELNEAEQTATKLEQMLDKIDAKMESILSSDDLRELEQLQAQMKASMESAQIEDTAEEQGGKEDKPASS